MIKILTRTILYAGLIAMALTPLFFSSDKSIQSDKMEKQEETDKNDEKNITAKDILEEDEKEEEENYEVVKFYTYDEKVRFTILNTVGYSPLALESLKRDIEIVYTDIKYEMEDLLEQQTEVYVTLKIDETMDESLDAGNGYINLYNYDPDTEWMYYLTVSAIFRDDYNYKGINRLPREILALYFETYYGVINVDPYSQDFISYINSNDARIPLKELLSTERYNNNMEYDDYVSDEVLLEYEVNYYWYVHFQALSFMNYYIDTFGLESFSTLYDQLDLVKAIEEETGMSISQLEEEWLDYIEIYDYEEEGTDSL